MSKIKLRAIEPEDLDLLYQIENSPACGMWVALMCLTRAIRYTTI